MKGEPTRPAVTCAACNGCGKVALPDPLWEVITLLRQTGPSTAQHLHQLLRFDGEVTAINNRLEDLRLLGLATRQRMGRRYVYRPVGDGR